MSYQSYISSNCIVVDDRDTPPPIPRALRRRGMGTGYQQRNYQKHPFGSLAEPLGDGFTFPREELYDRIREREALKITNKEVALRKGWEIKNQRSIPYCWVFGVTGAAEVVGIMEGHEYVKLSPSSVGSKVTNFRSVGGWGDNAARYAAKYGWVPQDLWPEVAIDRRYDKPENWEAAKRYVIKDWNELRPRSLDEMFACLLRGLPVPVGFNWWRHLVFAMDPKIFDKPRASSEGGISDRELLRCFGTEIANSWGPNWSANGFGILKGSKQLADGQVCVRSMTPLMTA